MFMCLGFALAAWGYGRKNCPFFPWCKRGLDRSGLGAEAMQVGFEAFHGAQGYFSHLLVRNALRRCDTVRPRARSESIMLSFVFLGLWEFLLRRTFHPNRSIRRWTCAGS